MTYEELAATFPDGLVPPTSENAVLLGISENDIKGMNAVKVDRKKDQQALSDVGNDLAKLGTGPDPTILFLVELVGVTKQKVDALEQALERKDHDQLLSDIVNKLSDIAGKIDSAAEGLNTLADICGHLKVACQNMAKKVDPDATPDPSYESDFLEDVNG